MQEFPNGNLKESEVSFLTVVNWNELRTTQVTPPALFKKRVFDSAFFESFWLFNEKICVVASFVSKISAKNLFLRNFCNAKVCCASDKIIVETTWYQAKIFDRKMKTPSGSIREYQFLRKTGIGFWLCAFFLHVYVTCRNRVNVY